MPKDRSSSSDSKCYLSAGAFHTKLQQRVNEWINMKVTDGLIYFAVQMMLNTVANGCAAKEQKTHVRRLGRFYEFNSEDEPFAVTRNLRLYRGENIYGRITVPWTRSDWTLSVSAFWSDDHYSTPMWVFIKKSGLASNSDFDKVSISFRRQKVSRLRVENAEPGSYTIMIEGISDDSRVTVVVSVLPSDADPSEFEQYIAYRPYQSQEWSTSNEVFRQQLP